MTVSYYNGLNNYDDGKQDESAAVKDDFNHKEQNEDAKDYVSAV